MGVCWDLSFQHWQMGCHVGLQTSMSLWQTEVSEVSAWILHHVHRFTCNLPIDLDCYVSTVILHKTHIFHLVRKIIDSNIPKGMGICDSSHGKTHHHFNGTSLHGTRFPFKAGWVGFWKLHLYVRIYIYILYVCVLYQWQYCEKLPHMMFRNTKRRFERYIQSFHDI